jgi:hypothetical protein
MSESKTAQQQAADVIEKAEKGKDLSPAEQRAYERAATEANEERGYAPFLYHGRQMYRILDSPSHTFDTELQAGEFVMRMRVQRNLTES